MVIHSLPWLVVGVVGAAVALIAVGFGIGRVVMDQENREAAVFILKVLGAALAFSIFVCLTIAGFCYAFGG